MATYDKNKVKPIKPKLPTLNEQAFYAHLDVLYEALKCSDTACARILGISKSTFHRWWTKPPTWPYWNIVIRHVVIRTMASIEAKYGITKKHRRKIAEALSQLPRGDDTEEAIDIAVGKEIGSVAHVRAALAASPGGEQLRSDLMLAANSGGYNKQTLDRAARRLGVIRRQVGYGDNKDSLWRLPTSDDVQPDLSRPLRPDQEM